MRNTVLSNRSYSTKAKRARASGSHLEDIVGPVVAVPVLGPRAVVPQAELYPGPDGQRAHRQPEGELVGKAVAGAGDVGRRQLREGAPAVDGPADGDRLVVVDVEDADDAGDGGGGLHVGILQAHLLAHHGVEEVGGAAGLAEHGHQGGERRRRRLSRTMRNVKHLQHRKLNITPTILALNIL